MSKPFNFAVIPLQRSFSNRTANRCEELLKDRSLGSELVVERHYDNDVNVREYVYVKTEDGYKIVERIL